jgi:hypothetical protein
MFEYFELYNGNAISIIDERWKRNLELGTVRISEHKMTISSQFSKRNQIFSLGKWQKTSPLCVKNRDIMSMDLVVVDNND